MQEAYIKDFDSWNEKKKALNTRELSDDFFALEGEIWWASLGVNIGKEIDGKNSDFERPVLILLAIDYDALWTLPVTSTLKEDDKRFYEVEFGGKRSAVLLHQIRYASANRLSKLMGRISEDELACIRENVIKLIHKQEIPR
jgi:mRNA interferase MazF